MLLSSINYCNASPNNSSLKKTKESTYEHKLFQKAESFFKNSQFDSAFYYYDKSSNIFFLNKNWEMYLKCQIQISYYYFLNIDKEKALEIIISAENFAKRHFDNNHIIFSSIFHRKGSILIGLRKYSESIRLLTKSIEIRIEENGILDSLLAPTYNSFGNNYFYLGDYDTAFEYYKKALFIAEKSSIRPDKGLANYNQSIGIIYSIKGEIKQAAIYYKKSLEINEQILSKNNPELALNYENFGAFNAQNGNYNTALKYFNKAENIYKLKFGKEYNKLGTIYLNKGTVYSNQSDFKKALIYYKKSLQLYKIHNSFDHPDILKLYYNIGLLYYWQFDYKMALVYFKKSLDSKASTTTRISAIRNSANSYFKINDLENAKNNYLLAIDECRELYGNNHKQLALCYLNYGDFNLKIKDNDKGLEYFNKALNIYLNNYGEKNSDVSNCYSKIAKYYYEKQDYVESLKYYQRSLISIVPEFDNKNIYSNPDINNSFLDINLLNALRWKANCLYYYSLDVSHDEKDLKTSLETYELSIKLIEKIRNKYSYQESKLFIVDIAKNVFSNAINTSLLLYKHTGNIKYKEAAFQYSEKSKSVVFLSSIKDIKAKKFAKVPQLLVKFEINIKNNISLYEKLIYDEQQKTNPNKNKISLWESQLFELNKKYEMIISYIENKYPEYFKLKYDNSVVDIKNIQKQLKNDQALIEYTLSDTVLFIFLVTSDKFKVFNISINKDFHNNIEILRNSISNRNFLTDVNNTYNNYTNAAYNLYLKLLKPAEKVIANKKLIIIPDDKLGYIPFDILLTKLPKGNIIDYNKLSYLIKSNSISYLYSGTLHFSKINKQKSHRKKLLAFAPTYENINEIKKTNPEVDRTNILDYLFPLPAAKKEVKSINRIIKGDIFLDYDATEKNFVELAQNYDILHLAMHTIIVDENPMYSKLVFTLNKDNPEDGFLNTYEIYNLNISSSMVVLSACNTGTGKLQRGEGIMSLARGFLYSGCQSIIMTLWTSDDISGADLMNKFYKYLSKGKTKDEALRLAKLDFLKKADKLKSQPYFWAGYVCIGDTKTISKLNKFNNYIIYISIFILLIIIIVIIRYRRKNKT